MDFELVSGKLNRKYTLYINTRSISIYDKEKEVITTEKDIGISDVVRILKQYELEVS